MKIKLENCLILLIEFFAYPCFNIIQHFNQVLTNENRNNCRRRFICAHAMIITCRSNRRSENISVIMYGFDGVYKEGKEHQIRFWCFAGRQKIYAGICSHAPVVVLTATVNAGKRFLMM